MHFVRALAVGQVVQTLDDAFLVEVDGNGAAGFGHFQALRQAVDGDDLLGTEENCTADRHLADRAAAPNGDRIGRFDVALNGGLPAGRKNVAEKQKLLVRNALGHLDMGGIGKGHPEILRLAAWIASREVRVAEQSRRRMAEDLVGKILVAVRSFAHGKISPPALIALAADDGERHNDPVAGLQVTVDPGPDLDDLAHHFVAHDVARQHRRDEVMKEMEVRAADCTTRHFDDGIPRVFDLRVRHGIASDVFLSMPNQGSHAGLLFWKVLFSELLSGVPTAFSNDENSSRPRKVAWGCLKSRSSFHPSRPASEPADPDDGARKRLDGRVKPGDQGREGIAWNRS